MNALNNTKEKKKEGLFSIKIRKSIQVRYVAHFYASFTDADVPLSRQHTIKNTRNVLFDNLNYS